MTHTIALVSKAAVILVLFCDVREREQEQRKEKLCHSEEWGAGERSEIKEGSRNLVGRIKSKINHCEA